MGLAGSAPCGGPRKHNPSLSGNRDAQKLLGQSTGMAGADLKQSNLREIQTGEDPLAHHKH